MNEQHCNACRYTFDVDALEDVVYDSDDKDAKVMCPNCLSTDLTATQTRASLKPDGEN